MGPLYVEGKVQGVSTGTTGVRASQSSCCMEAPLFTAIECWQLRLNTHLGGGRGGRSGGVLRREGEGSALETRK